MCHDIIIIIVCWYVNCLFVFFFKQKTAYEMRISDWSSDVCSSDLIAAIAGAVLAARHRRIPVLLDGFICCAAMAPLAVANPAITAHCLAGHCSAEPGHARLLELLGLDPLLRLGMRLGEGSGAAVAASIVRAALAAHNGKVGRASCRERVCQYV